MTRFRKTPSRMRKEWVRSGLLLKSPMVEDSEGIKVYNDGNASRSAKTIYGAVIGAKNAGRCSLPKDVEKRLASFFNGIDIPAGKKGRKEFLAHVGSISDKIFMKRQNLSSLGRLLRLGDMIPDILYKKTMGLVEERMEQIADALRAAQRSGNTMEYLRFLSDKRLDVFQFKGSVMPYCGDRRIAFEDVPKGKLAVRDRMLELLLSPEDGSKEELAAILNDIMVREFDIYQDDDFNAVDEVYPMMCLLMQDAEAALDVIRRAYPRESRSHEELVRYMHETGVLPSGDPWDRGRHNADIGNGSYILEMYGLFSFILDEELILIPFNQRARFGDTNIYISECPALPVLNDMSSAYFSKYQDSTILLLSKEHDTIVHEQQHRFDRMIGVFDNPSETEYRAYLAELAFSDDPAGMYEQIEQNIPKLMDFAIIKFLGVMGFSTGASPIFSGSRKDFRSLARTLARVTDAIGEGERSEDGIRKAALRALNRDYQEESGLSYEGILKGYRDVWTAEESRRRSRGLFGSRKAPNEGAGMH